MTFNQKMISKHIEGYKEGYKAQFKENPTSWYGYLTWLSQSTNAGNFEYEDIELVKNLLK